MKHMAVIYNKELDALIYDRKLQDGPGNSLYGLEVCKSLQLPQDFIDMAYQIRNKSSPLLLKTSKYNAKHIVGLCELCKKQGTEVHHLEYQQDAKDGWITKDDFYFPVNHPANLVTLCDTCHDDIHDKKKKMKGGYSSLRDNILNVSSLSFKYKEFVPLNFNAQIVDF